MPSPLPRVEPKHLHSNNDQCRADDAFQRINQGEHLLWEGDYHNGVQLLSALARRIDKRRKPFTGTSPAESFNRHRQNQSQKTSLLNRVVVAIEPGYILSLRRAPEIRAACEAAFGPLNTSCLLPLRAIQGALSAYAWELKGVRVEGLCSPVSVRYGVFSPIRGEYLDLVRNAALPDHARTAFDIGTGSGVIAALLASRGIKHITATDTNNDALACAHTNVQRLGLNNRIQLVHTSLFPDGQADLIVCNPPWLPGRPTSPVETAIYDPDNQMISGFLEQLPLHLAANGQAWLIVSDLAQRLGLRPARFIPELAARYGLRVLGRMETKPVHGKTQNPKDPLQAIRAQETTVLWKLVT